MYQRAIELLGAKIGALESNNALLQAQLEEKIQRINELEQENELLRQEQAKEVVENGENTEL